MSQACPRRPIKLSPLAKQELRSFCLEDLEVEIQRKKRNINNLRILGFHRQAEKERQSLRFLWELHSELVGKIDDIEEEDVK